MNTENSLGEMHGDTHSPNHVKEAVSSEPKDDALARLQEQISSEKDKRREERFYWICLVIFIFDIFEFKEMKTWSGPLSVVFLQFIVLIALGRKLGIDNIWTLTERFLEKWNGTFGAGS